MLLNASINIVLCSKHPFESYNILPLGIATNSQVEFLSMDCISFFIEICHSEFSTPSSKHIGSEVYKAKLQESYISLKDLNFLFIEHNIPANYHFATYRII